MHLVADVDSASAAANGAVELAAWPAAAAWPEEAPPPAICGPPEPAGGFVPAGPPAPFLRDPAPAWW
jgi:hypothetical protein